MPNYEFYAQMAQIRADRYQQQYQEAYNAAYRDLMTEYKDQMLVREMLMEQLAIDKKNNAQILKLISGSGSSPELFQLQKWIYSAEGGNISRTLASTKVNLDTKKQIEDKYTLPNSVITTMNDVISRIKSGSIVGIGSARGDRNVNLMIKNALADLNPAQMNVFGSKYPFILQEAFARQGITGEDVGMYNIADELGVPIVDPNEVLKRKQEELDNVAPIQGTTPWQNEQLKKIKQKAANLENAEVDVDIENGKLVLLLSSMTPIQEFSKEDLTLKPPTEQEILAKTADYYKPFGSEEFKTAMTERDIAKEEQAMLQRNKQLQEQEAEALAKEELLSSLPSWSNRVLKVAGQAEEIIEIDEEDLKKRGQPETFSLMLTKRPDYDLPSSIDIIDKEFDNPTDRENALSVLWMDHLKKRRAKKATEIDIPQEIEP